MQKWFQKTFEIAGLEQPSAEVEVGNGKMKYIYTQHYSKLVHLSIQLRKICFILKTFEIATDSFLCNKEQRAKKIMMSVYKN